MLKRSASMSFLESLEVRKEGRVDGWIGGWRVSGVWREESGLSIPWVWSLSIIKTDSGNGSPQGDILDATELCTQCS